MSVDVRPVPHPFETFFGLVAVGLFAALWLVSDTPEVALVFLPIVPIALRTSMVRAWTDRDQLHVRNFWRTDSLERRAIAGFLVEDDLEYKASRRRTVYVYLHDQQRRRLSASKRVYRKLFPVLPANGKRNEADDICAELNAWLKSGA